MKKLILFAIAIFLSIYAFFSAFSYERIDAGCEGIKVNLYGDDKGVEDVSMCTGAVWYCNWTTAVYEYPTYVQTIDYDTFTTNSKEGSEFTLDP